MSVISKIAPEFYWKSQINKARRRLGTEGFDCSDKSVGCVLERANETAVNYLHENDSPLRNFLLYGAPSIKCLHYAVHTYGNFLDLSKECLGLQEGVSLAIGFVHGARENSEIKFSDVVGLHAFLETKSSGSPRYFEPVPNNEKHFKENGLTCYVGSRIRMDPLGEVFIKRDIKVVDFLRSYKLDKYAL